ncbi:fasciclin domain-containing protein [Flavobacteriales bacterium]|nr:fasciclin domain-containing protein [Flavobacteriales bacterium]MDB4088468.1 fasciclin domain-containing protein [Flavobacteriales bacterium]
MKKLILNVSYFLLAGSLIFISCKKDDDPIVTPTPTVNGDDIIDVAIASGFDSLAVALTEANLVSTFQGDDSGPFTVFAPTNIAFVNLLNSNPVWNRISDIDNTLLTEVLKYHVLNGKVSSDLIIDGNFVNTLSGYTFKINITGAVTIDVNATTGTGINVTSVDVAASNGVIHVIDQVLIPSIPTTIPTQTIAQLAVAAGLDSLVVALSEANLVTTFDGSNGNFYTVFAPTNSAFVNVLATNPAWNRISDIDNTLLTAVLTFHVSNGTIQAGQLSDGQTINTLESTDLTFNATGTTLTGGSSTSVGISSVDNYATNGVVHVIDEVLLP